MTTRNTLKRQTFRPPAGFEPAIAASERPQTHALDRAATAIGNIPALIQKNSRLYLKKEGSLPCSQEQPNGT